MRRYSTTVILTLTFALPMLTACSDVTGPPHPEMTAYVTDVSSGASGVPQGSGEALGTTAAQVASDSFTGSLSGAAQVMIYSETQGWFAVGSPRDLSLRLQAGDSSAVASAATIPSDTYTRVRLVLAGCAADLHAGSVIGGVPLSSALNLALGGSDNYATIDIDVPPFTVSAAGTAKVRLDLHSAAWVNQTNVGSQAVSDAELQAATTVSITSG